MPKEFTFEKFTCCMNEKCFPVEMKLANDTCFISAGCGL
jgi:hypothetical protein